MPDEEYERIKAAEKEHLRKMKALKEAARRLARSQNVQRGNEAVNRKAQDTLAENKALTHRLLEEAAQSEARLDLALEESDNDASSDERSSDPKARARDLVRRLREEMDAGAPGDDADQTDSPDDRPNKTIGRGS